MSEIEAYSAQTRTIQELYRHAVERLPKELQKERLQKERLPKQVCVTII